MAKTKPKTMFNEAETKALIVKYYRLYEHKKLESVSIVVRPEKSNLVKALKAKTSFCVKYKEVVSDFEKVFEEWLDPEDICHDLEQMFEELGFRDMTLTVSSEMDEEYLDKNSNETARKGHFVGVIFEYTRNLNNYYEPKEPEKELQETENLIAQSLSVEQQFNEIPVINEVDAGLGLRYGK